MIEMILRTEEEKRLLWDAIVECGAVVGVWGNYGFLRSASRPEDGGVLPRLAHCFCRRSGWGGAVAGLTAVAAVGTVHRPPRMLEVGQEAEFYMVVDDPPSTRGGGGGSGRLAARIVPWPRVQRAGVKSAPPALAAGGGQGGWQ